MRSFLRAALGSLFLAASPVLAQTNYTTNITLSHLLTSGGPTPYATVCATPVDVYGNPITVSAPTWGLLVANTQFCGSVVNGAVSGGINVPDAAHTNAGVPIYYSFRIQQTSSTGTAVGLQVDLKSVPNVSNTSFSLDSYSPAVASPITPSGALVAGSSVPGSCTSPSLYDDSENGVLYHCIAGSYSAVQGSASGATSASAGTVQLAQDLGGTATAPKVVGIQGVPVTNTTPTNGQVLSFNGSGYAPTTPAAATSVTSSATVQQANGLTQVRAANASCALGLHVQGDSNSVSGDGTIAALGWGAQLDADCGLVANSTVAANQLAVWEFAQGGNQMADVTWKIFTYENPGDFGNPLVTLLDVGGNNSTYDASDTIGFEQDAYAALTWPAISSTNKVVMGSNSNVTWTGSCTTDTTFANVSGLTCASGAVITWTASVGPQGTAYFYAKSQPTTSGSGTFNVSSGSTVLSDTISSSSTINPFIPLVRWYQGSINTFCTGTSGPPCGAIASRYTGLTYGQQTFHATVLSGTVTFLAFAAPAMNDHAVSATGPRVIMSDIPHRMAYTNDATTLAFDALDLGIAQTLLGDRLNVPYIELLSVIDTLNDYSLTPTISPVCAASNVTGHWNDCGQKHALAAVEAAVGLTPINPNPIFASVTSTGATNTSSSNVGSAAAFQQAAYAGSQNVQGTTAAAVLSAGYNGPGGSPVAGQLKVLNSNGNGLTCTGTSDGSNGLNCNQTSGNMIFTGTFTYYGTNNFLGGGALNGYNVNNPTFYFNGAGNGFSGTKVMGSCTVVITSGVITSVTGC